LPVFSDWVHPEKFTNRLRANLSQGKHWFIKNKPEKTKPANTNTKKFICELFTFYEKVSPFLINLYAITT